MAFCTNCGSQIPDGTKFCPSCGQKPTASPPPVPPMPSAPEISARENTPAQDTYQNTYTPPVQQDRTPPTPEETPVQGSYQGSYTPPAAQNNAPPAKEEAPVQGSYSPPSQQSYTPPVQQSYSAQPAASVATRPAKEKKPLNKKLLFIIGGAAVVVILAIILISVLGGKGGGNTASSDPNAGLYTAVTAEMMGMEMEVADFWPGGFTIELMDKGKCALEIDGAKTNGKWTLDGDEFHVEGGGIECDGTLSNGAMILENVLDMGITLNFSKEGGAVGAQGAQAGATDLQKQWNGTWYGVLYVNNATGDFAGAEAGGLYEYDAYIVVDVDAKGEGQFAVYLGAADEAFALANCEAKPEGLYATDGTIAGGYEMYAYNWMFLPHQDYDGQYTMTDDIEDGDSEFGFSIFMAKWGYNWQEAMDDNDLALIPPSVEAYHAAIANGELPPVGFAPMDYEGTAAPSDNGGESAEPDEPTEPDEPNEPEAGTSGGEYGMSEAGATGIVTEDVLSAIVKWAIENNDPDTANFTYEDIYNIAGHVHGVFQPDTVGYYQYKWSTEDGKYVYMNFIEDDDGVQRYSSMSYTWGLQD